MRLLCYSPHEQRCLLQAPAGMNGPICVFLYGPVTNPSPTPFTGHFGQGVITEACRITPTVRHLSLQIAMPGPDLTPHSRCSNRAKLRH